MRNVPAIRLNVVRAPYSSDRKPDDRWKGSRVSGKVPDMSTAISMTREELKQRREALLGKVGMTYEQLRERAESYTLREDERAAYEAIRSIDYLLSE
jgi:hypothetical protein